ncbi:thioesterase family protein [Phellopilus nigrolimitatus]|nr:thioesterase family protein [Phellopilus nigrolimitatus]
MAKSKSKISARSRNDYRYFQTYRTRWSDNDQYSHVNNSIYYHLIDSIVNTYLTERCGCIPSTSTDAGQSNVGNPLIGLVVTSYCSFFAPLSFPEPITLGLRVVSLGRSSVSYEIGFFSGSSTDSEGQKEEDTAKAVGGYTHVFVDRVTRRPVKVMSAELEDGLRAVLVENKDEGHIDSPKSKL